MNAAERQEKISDHLNKQAESYERCDTDGFMSQMSHGVMASLHETERDLEATNGYELATGLYTLDGQRIRAKLIDGKFGMCWAFCDMNDKFTGRFEKYAPVRKSTHTKKGIVERYIEAVQVKAEIMDWHVYTFRTDKGYPEHAVAV